MQVKETVRYKYTHLCQYCKKHKGLIYAKSYQMLDIITEHLTEIVDLKQPFTNEHLPSVLCRPSLQPSLLDTKREKDRFSQEEFIGILSRSC